MKKTLAIILALSLLCIMAVGTTLTYFTDTDGATNTMTVGKVTITQNETFNTNAKLFPYIGAIPTDSDYDSAKNAVTKTVTVTNTGSEIAYIRTLFAFEAVNGQDPVGTTIHVNYNKDTTVGTWKAVAMDPIQLTEVVDNIEVTTKYYVYSFTYTASYEKNVETEHSLKQIALDCSAANEFSNAINGEYDILALSQAVQKQGFDNAEAAFAAAFPYDANTVAGWFN